MVTIGKYSGDNIRKFSDFKKTLQKIIVAILYVNVMGFLFYPVIHQTTSKYYTELITDSIPLIKGVIYFDISFVLFIFLIFIVLNILGNIVLIIYDFITSVKK